MHLLLSGSFKQRLRAGLNIITNEYVSSDLYWDINVPLYRFLIYHYDSAEFIKLCVKEDFK